MASEIKANKISPATGTAFTFGDSGDTFTIPSGATIANSGTATGFGLTGWSVDGGNNDLLPASASAGIYLGVSSATAANLLDDYEEGTWTPVPKVGGVDCNQGGDPSTGKYTKIGRFVFWGASVHINRATNTGTFSLTGLPFAPNSTSASQVGVMFRGNDYVTLHDADPYLNFPLTWTASNDSIIYNYVEPKNQSTQLAGATGEIMIGTSANRFFTLAGGFAIA